MIDDLLQKENLELDDVITLLNIDNKSADFYRLISKANEYARTHFTKGYVFMQIGLNTEPCSGNCKFCSMARDNFVTEKCWVMSKDNLRKRLKEIPSFVSDVFLMTTADYDKGQFLEFCSLAREELDPSIRVVANFSDFDDGFAAKLRDRGVNACYHIRRLREGIDTGINIKIREKTIEAIEKSGMDLYYCIEPIGKEHTYREIGEEIIFAKEHHVDVMAVMRRVDVGSDHSSEINLLEVTKIVAVALLAVRPTKSMNVHEPNAMSLLAGVNQLYAEQGGNPRDLVVDTSLGRGINAYQAKRLLEENDWAVY